MDNILNPRTDYILLDLSKHQPDLISTINKDFLILDNQTILNKLAPIMKKNKVPVLLADDTTTDLMNSFIQILKENEVLLAGIDMQNSVELPRNEQSYQILNNGIESYQVKIRKSPDSLSQWNPFVKRFQ